MRTHLSRLWPGLALLGLLSSSAARAQGTQSSTTSLDALKRALKEELRDELLEELRATQPAAGEVAPVQSDSWAEEEWKWEEPVKPELNFFELDGYFRFRYQLFKSLDLDTTYVNTETGVISGPFSPGLAPPTPICDLDVQDRGAAGVDAARSCANKIGDTTTLGGANMRLRLEPTLNVYEDVKVRMQLDILDNLVLGSTPDGFPKSAYVPLIAFSQGQLAPSDGYNALIDSIRVKRVWAEIGTPLGQLRVGRMPSHFGLGILANEGRGLDADYGDSSDRILFATKIGDFYVIPGFDWAVSGPTSASPLVTSGQPFDRDQRDDVDQYILAVARRDKDQEIKEKLENDELVLNYGTYQVYRTQALDAASYYASGDPADGSSPAQRLVRRDAQAWIYSFWLKLLWKKLSIEAEYAGIIGSVRNTQVAGGFADQDLAIDLSQHGGAIQAEYKLLRDALTLSLNIVVASGDSAPGWGLLPLSDSAPTPGSWDGSQASAADPNITNFRFDPGYYVDLIFWRQLVGQITDALIIRPGVQYNITEGFGARLDLVYSRALFSESTPSASRGTDQDANLGLETDLKLFYSSEDGFHAWLQYGLFLPFAGMDRDVSTETGTQFLSSGIAQTLQAMLAVSF